MRKIFIIAVLLLLLLPSALAIDRVISNSPDWHDVYSSMLFATLKGVPSHFLTSQKHGAILPYSIPKTDDNLLVVSSRTKPYVVGYGNFLESKGYNVVEDMVTRDANLDLANRLTNITKFVVIDPAYGYNALSAGPYAAVSNSYVLFADSRNINDVVDFLSGRTVDQLLLFGQLDREVKDSLAQFGPETINEGDRFSNNLAMVDRYADYADLKQVILTNGEFLEQSLMSGQDPVLFIGKAHVPEIVQEYVQSHNIEVGILVGNELIGTATFVRRQLGISVFVKFAQGARTPQGAIAQVEDLDRFPMPSYQVQLEIQSISYNQATRSLEVTYRNPVDLGVYLKSTISITGGNESITLGDNEALFLDKGGVKTVVYTADVDGNPLFLDKGTEYMAELLTIYGEGPKSLENSLQAKVPISFIDVMDDSVVEITGLYYDKSKGAFMVTVKNTGTVDAYVQPEIVDLMINGEAVTVASDSVEKLAPGEEKKIPVSVEMADADFEENPMIHVRAFYGERELALIKMTEKSFALEFGGFPTGKIILYAVIVLILFLILFFLGTKKKCKQCGHKNPRGRKTCEKCHNKL